MYIYVAYAYWSFNHILAETSTLNSFSLYFLSAQATNGFYTTHSCCPSSRMYMQILTFFTPYWSLLHLPFAHLYLCPKVSYSHGKQHFPSVSACALLVWTRFFSAVSNLGQWKFKLTQQSGKKWEQIQSRNAPVPCQSQHFTLLLCHFSLSPTHLMIANSSLFITLFCHKQLNWKQNSIFLFFPILIELQIFSLEPSLQESVLDTSELSVSLPTSPCSTSWLGHACHSLLNHLCASLSQHRPENSQHSPAEPGASTAKKSTLLQELPSALLPTWSSGRTEAEAYWGKTETSCLASTDHTACTQYNDIIQLPFYFFFHVYNLA